MVIIPSVFISGCTLFQRKPKAQPPLKIENVGLDKKEFNPAEGEEVSISFVLPRKAAVLLEIYDNQGRLIYQSEEKDMARGKNTVSWDGRDAREQIVPDEASIYVLVAVDSTGKEYIHNPSQRTGGDKLKISDVSYDKKKGAIRYFLPQAGRVRIRVGVEEGPLMVCLLDWVPLSSGMKSEPWGGCDVSGVLIPENRRKIVVSAFSLPINTVITRGNPVQKAANPVHPPKNISIEPGATVRPVHPHARLPHERRRSPRFSVSFPEHEATDKNGLPILSGRVPVKIEIDEEDKRWLTDIRFEIMLYLDYVFIFEDEDAYTPFTYTWDTRHLNEGEHLLTVNVQGYGDHIGAQSKRVFIKRSSRLPEEQGKDAQALVEKITAKYPQIVRLTIHAIPSGESKSRIIACNISEKIGKLSDPEDLEAMAQNKSIVLREGDNLDVTAPICNREGAPMAATGITLRFQEGESEKELTEKALSIAKELTGEIQSAGKPLW